MHTLGKTQTLPVLKPYRRGLLLGDPEHPVFLPPRELAADVPEDATDLPESVEVFVYADSEGRPVGTTAEPYGELGDFVLLRCVDVTEHGAFVDWGVGKDLFVPFGRMHEPMRVGQEYVLAIRYDADTDRLYGSTVLKGAFDDGVDHLAVGQPVDLLVFGRNNTGYQVVVDNRHAGLVYHDQVFDRLRYGQTLTGYVAGVRPDHRLDITLRKPGHAGTLDAKGTILDALERAGGHLRLHDKSDPDEIRRVLGMSKKVFKKAVGGLLREGRVTLGPDGVRLPARAP